MDLPLAKVVPSGGGGASRPAKKEVLLVPEQRFCCSPWRRPW